MTDQEIIKALEYCKDCSVNLNFEIINGIERTNIELLDLAEIINRQRAEIKEFEKLEDQLRAEKADVMYYKQQIKAEAVREFVEKLKERAHIRYMIAIQEDQYQILGRDLYSLVKEMVGDNK